MQAIHPIGVVERRTGLSAHVIRVWERRYGAVDPVRSGGNQRLYTDADIERLELLAKAVSNGESIGRIARLPNEELQHIVAAQKQQNPVPSSTHELSTTEPEPAIQRAIESIEMSDGKGLRTILSGWLYTHGIVDLIEKFVPELLNRIGERWQAGDLKIYQEHMASETIRSFLGTVFDDVSTGDRGETIITATPPDEFHDIGALLCAITAATMGFDVVHLGSDVPIPELVRFALIRRPAAILLSFVFSSANEKLVQGIQNLREMIDPETRIFIGGRGAGWYRDRLYGHGIEYLDYLSDLRTTLETLAPAG